MATPNLDAVRAGSTGPPQAEYAALDPAVIGVGVVRGSRPNRAVLIARTRRDSRDHGLGIKRLFSPAALRVPQPDHSGSECERAS